MSDLCLTLFNIRALCSSNSSYKHLEIQAPRHTCDSSYERFEIRVFSKKLFVGDFLQFFFVNDSLPSFLLTTIVSNFFPNFIFSKNFFSQIFLAKKFFFFKKSGGETECLPGLLVFFPKFFFSAYRWCRGRVAWMFSGCRWGTRTRGGVPKIFLPKIFSPNFFSQNLIKFKWVKNVFFWHVWTEFIQVFSDRWLLIIYNLFSIYKLSLCITADKLYIFFQLITHAVELMAWIINI